MKEPLLRIEDLWLRRDDRTILQGVNLELNPGEVHVLLGLNGSGKSSLAYTIMGCEGYTPDSGRILFDGQDLADLSITERAKLGITLAWQEPARFEGIPIGKYVGLGQEQASRQMVATTLEAVSLPAKYYGYRAADKTLSGGERKRVELASVYAMQPRLAILDEPDSGIDVLSVGDIAMLIRRMALEGSAVLLITHSDEIVEMADVASLMCAGTIIFSGKPQEARRYFSTRCMPHLESLGSQPWDVTKPEVRAALASNGMGRFVPGEAGNDG
ncbi:MAG: ATP-binding cassette domain-containing protein [Anaerolineales bacterium]|nr:ATP-binding cassette domain-containing protein [Anaerolineales bacterium]